MNPGQNIDILPPPTGLDLADFAMQANMRAKVNRPPKAQRSRVPWSHSEIQALLEYIGEYGDDGNIPYAHIKATDKTGDQFLSDRDGEDLRFKARNLKMDFLRSVIP